MYFTDRVKRLKEENEIQDHYLFNELRHWLIHIYENLLIREAAGLSDEDIFYLKPFFDLYDRLKACYEDEKKYYIFSSLLLRHSMALKITRHAADMLKAISLQEDPLQIFDRFQQDCKKTYIDCRKFTPTQMYSALKTVAETFLKTIKWALAGAFIIGMTGLVTTGGTMAWQAALVGAVFGGIVGCFNGGAEVDENNGDAFKKMINWCFFKPTKDDGVFEQVEQITGRSMKEAVKNRLREGDPLLRTAGI